MSLLAWAQLYEDMLARTVADDVVETGFGKAWVRTVWIGEAAGFSPCRTDRVFGTGVRYSQGEHWSEVRNYQTKEEAASGHREIIGMLVAR
jgi:hypothetical protein